MQDLTWLAADYHVPTTYSCRVPMSSPHSALAMPAPGPATVRLALIRTGIEVFGDGYTRERLFPIIRSAEIRVRPPERVAFSTQILRGYKVSEESANRPTSYTESIGYRELVHASGSMTLFLNVPSSAELEFASLLQSIGYWGQSDSLVCCTNVRHTEPPDGEYALKFSDLSPSLQVQDYFVCIAGEFSSEQVRWSEVMPDISQTGSPAIRLDLYIWPLVVREQHSGGRVLHYRSLMDFGRQRPPHDWLLHHNSQCS